MPETPRLGLPLIAAGQSQKDVTHNEAVLALDSMVALAVASRSQIVPPTQPESGETHIVPQGGAAAWSHPAGTLVQWQNPGWLPQTPRDGLSALVLDEGIMLIHRGDWQSAWPVAGLEIGGRSLLAAPPVTIAPPMGGATVDAEARSALTALLAALASQGILAT
ncbi:MAG: DUF2793 domain-containing protein [Sandarakinorhabdus sp.]|jgi:hypothetical protein|nr:DUF2793 domain-containing protein [Sandarakinorhabdus sp.]